MELEATTGTLAPVDKASEAAADAGRAFMARDKAGQLFLVGSNPRGGVSLYWEFRPEWAAWWLMVRDGELTAARGYGPFSALEAEMAGKVHGVPFFPRNE